MSNYTNMQYERNVSSVDVWHWRVRMGRIWNFIRIEYRIEYPRNFEYESNFESNTNIRLLQTRLEYWTVSRCLAGTRRHPVAMGISPCRSRRHCGHKHRSFCLLSDLTMKTTSYSRQTYHRICCTYTDSRLQNKIIYIYTFYASPKVTVTLSKPKLISTNPKLTWNPYLKP